MPHAICIVFLKKIVPKFTFFLKLWLCILLDQNTPGIWKSRVSWLVPFLCDSPPPIKISSRLLISWSPPLQLIVVVIPSFHLQIIFVFGKIVLISFSWPIVVDSLVLRRSSRFLSFLLIVVAAPRHESINDGANQTGIWLSLQLRVVMYILVMSLFDLFTKLVKIEKNCDVILMHYLYDTFMIHSRTL